MGCGASSKVEVFKAANDNDALPTNDDDVSTERRKKNKRKPKGAKVKKGAQDASASTSSVDEGIAGLDPSGTDDDVGSHKSKKPKKQKGKKRNNRNKDISKLDHSGHHRDISRDSPRGSGDGTSSESISSGDDASYNAASKPVRASLAFKGPAVTKQLNISFDDDEDDWGIETQAIGKEQRVETNVHVSEMIENDSEMMQNFDASAFKSANSYNNNSHNNEDTSPSRSITNTKRSSLKKGKKKKSQKNASFTERLTKEERDEEDRRMIEGSSGDTLHESDAVNNNNSDTNNNNNNRVVSLDDDDYDSDNNSPDVNMKEKRLPKSGASRDPNAVGKFHISDEDLMAEILNDELD